MQTQYAPWSTCAPRSTTPFRHRRGEGFSLPELVLVMTIIGLALGGALPAASHLRDRLAVVGARESMVGIFHKARLEAVAFGGASIVLRVSPPEAELWAAGALRWTGTGDGGLVVVATPADRADTLAYLRLWPVPGTVILPDSASSAGGGGP